jgi:hypothetical protein
MNAPGPTFPQVYGPGVTPELLNIEAERLRLLRRCRSLREAIEELRSRNDRDALDQDLESSSGTPTDLDELGGGDRPTLDHSVGTSQVLVDEEGERRKAFGDAHVGRS